MQVPLGSVFASLRPCIAQLILANVYQGLAEGALSEAQKYTQSSRRPWIASQAASSHADPYVLHGYGELWLGIESSRLLTDRHCLVIEHSLRPLFAFLQAFVVPVGVYASQTDFTNGVLHSQLVLSRVNAAARQAARLVRPRHVALDAAPGALPIRVARV